MTTMAGFQLGIGVVDGVVLVVDEEVVDGEVLEAALGEDGEVAEILVMGMMIILGVAEEVLIEVTAADLGCQEVWMMIGLLEAHEQADHHPETGMSSASLTFIFLQ